jgi:hypothetical protein
MQGRRNQREVLGPYKTMLEAIDVLWDTYKELRELHQVKPDAIDVTPLSLEVNTDEMRLSYVVSSFEEEE